MRLAKEELNIYCVQAQKMANHKINLQTSNAPLEISV
jgi:hypothetical protein